MNCSDHQAAANKEKRQSFLNKILASFNNKEKS